MSLKMKVEFNIENCPDYKSEAEKGCIYFMMCFKGQEMGKSWYVRRGQGGHKCIVLLIHLYPEVYGFFFFFFKECAN